MGTYTQNLLPIMHKLPFSITLIIFLFSYSFSSAQERLTLQEALEQKLVQVRVKGNGGYRGKAIKLAIKNRTNKVVSLEILPGQMFASEDSSVQDLISTAPAMLAVGPKSIKSTSIYTMCTQSSNMSPRSNEVYTLGSMADSHLLKIVQKIAKHNYQTSTAQSAVWAVANRDPIRNIYGSDTSMVREMATVVSEATGTPMSEFNFVPTPHQITDIRTSMEILADKHYENAKLVLVDKEGEVIRRYFDNRKIEPGFMQYRVGASHTLGDTAELYLRLISGDKIIQEKAVTPADTVAPIQKIHAKAVMTFLVKKAGASSVGVYDENDQLYFYINENRQLPMGFNRGTYIAGKHLPPGKDYYIKVKMDGETLAEEKINPNAPEPKLFPRKRVNGYFSFKQKEVLRNAQIAVYDSDGKIKRILANANVLNPGNKKYSYSFEHFDGPDAIFYIRLTDKDGNVLQEKVVK